MFELTVKLFAVLVVGAGIALVGSAIVLGVLYIFEGI